MQGADDKPDVELLIRTVADHRADAQASRAAAQALAAPGVLDEFDDRGEGHLVRQQATDALTEFAINAADPSLREDAVIALAAIDRSAAVTACYCMFERHRDRDGDKPGPARRLLAHFTGEADPDVETLVRRLPHVDGFEGVLTQEALAEHGPEAVPVLLEALKQYPIPAQDGTGHWFEDETAKFRLMYALAGIGPEAAPATPTLIAILQDMAGYRDTRHAAKAALVAIGLPETAEALVAELPRKEGGLDWDGEALYFLLDALSGMPPEALANLPGLQDLVTEMREAPSNWLVSTAELITNKINKL